MYTESAERTGDGLNLRQRDKLNQQVADENCLPPCTNLILNRL